jgi:hypothetical protein|mmetsp:Transcript_58357/g.96730  ORF Transcript_58357/g.96730 Transcript_58357/m.96730 type:complete len:86 (+) Transcript_58357:1913-2170(+)
MLVMMEAWSASITAVISHASQHYSLNMATTLAQSSLYSHFGIDHLSQAEKISCDHLLLFFVNFHLVSLMHCMLHGNLTPHQNLKV